MLGSVVVLDGAVLGDSDMLGLGSDMLGLELGSDELLELGEAELLGLGEGLLLLAQREFKRKLFA